MKILNEEQRKNFSRGDERDLGNNGKYWGCIGVERIVLMVGWWMLKVGQCDISKIRGVFDR